MTEVHEKQSSKDPTVDDESKTQSDSKTKKKKSKFIDAILRDLPQNVSEEQKLNVLCQKYYDLQQEQKEHAGKTEQYKVLSKSIRSERDQLQGERNRLILQKDKLETLCRELQKQNKVIQTENLARTRAEEDKRREVADHFQTSITAIQTQLNEYQSRNTELRQENQDLADKLGKFINQHEKREKHVEKLLQTRDLEVKLAEAKLNKAQCLVDQERIKSQHKVAQLEEEAKLMQERMDMHKNLENKLREQIEFYKTKYQNFNKTISKSNKLFENAKDEMEKLAKRVKQSEHDVVEWRGKWELSQRSLLEVVAEHKKKVEEVEAAHKQTERMAGLCRALQSQLTELRQAGSGQTEPNEQGDGPTEVKTTEEPVTDNVKDLSQAFEIVDMTSDASLEVVNPCQADDLTNSPCIHLSPDQTS